MRERCSSQKPGEKKKSFQGVQNVFIKGSEGLLRFGSDVREARKG